MKTGKWLPVSKRFYTSERKGKAMFIIFVSLIWFASCLPLWANPSIFGKYKIETEKMNSDHLLKLEATLDFIEKLSANKTVVEKKRYERLSRFKNFFGFEFDGKRLNQWILQRTRKISIQKNSFFMAQNDGFELKLDPRFFSLPILEQAIILVHEARHSDGLEYSHSKCPDNFFYLSSRNLNADLSGADACDEIENGAYGFSSAFLFELIAYGLGDAETLAGKYNSELARIIRKY